jgi:hypothetical protein
VSACSNASNPNSNADFQPAATGAAVLVLAVIVLLLAGDTTLLLLLLLLLLLVPSARATATCAQQNVPAVQSGLILNTTAPSSLRLLAPQGASRASSTTGAPL